MNLKKLLPKATLILLLALWLSSPIACKPRVIYLEGDTERVVYLKKGEAAPYDGFLFTPSQTVRLYDRRGDKLPDTD